MGGVWKPLPESLQRGGGGRNAMLVVESVYIASNQSIVTYITIGAAAVVDNGRYKKRWVLRLIQVGVHSI